MKITIKRVGEQLQLSAPYNSLFVTAAKDCGGRWSSVEAVWLFDVRDEARIREHLMTYYGSDGVRRDVVTLRVRMLEERRAERGPLQLFGRTIARAHGRDTKATLGQGVIVEAGGYTGGGSAKNWATVGMKGTVILVRDFPRAKALEYVADKPEAFEIVDEEAPAAPVLQLVPAPAQRPVSLAIAALKDAIWRLQAVGLDTEPQQAALAALERLEV